MRRTKSTDVLSLSFWASVCGFKNVWPTKSGVTIERRDQVLIGFLTPEAFILSIFSRRYDSTKGPFFNDLAINFK